MRSLRRVILAGGTAALSLLAPARSGASDAPAWVREAARMPDPANVGTAGAVVLLHEQIVDWSKPDRRVVTTRRAVRVRTTKGRPFAQAGLGYCSDTDKVRSFRAWRVDVSGSVTEYGKEDVVDRTRLNGALYSEVRVQIITPSDIELGGVFASESVIEDRTPCGQARWDFQEDMPTLVSRLAISLPPGWRADAVPFNRPSVTPKTEGDYMVWEARDVPALPEEKSAPPEGGLVAGVAVNCMPGSGTPPDPSASFGDWPDVSRWVASVMDPMSASDDSIARTAQRLVGRAATRADSVRIIGRYVQRMQYAALELNMRQNGGTRPRPARTVLATGYGDCKDKANLMRSLLGSVGISAYPVILCASDPDYVRAEWPSPQVFDHCILAVSLPAGEDSYPHLRSEKAGDLVLFDPTDPYTMFGDLPAGEQGGMALPISAGGESLTRLPVLPAEKRLQDRRVEMTLAEDGSLSGRIEENAMGQGARERLMETGGVSSARLQRWAERWLGHHLGSATVSDAAMSVDSAQGRCSWQLRFDSPRAAQLLSDRMLVLRPFFFGSREESPCGEAARALPLRIEAEAYRESVSVRLPEGFVMEDLPPPAQVRSAFGSFEMTAGVEDGVLHCTRSVELTPGLVEPGRCPELRRFFDQLRTAETAQLVATRSP